jgi:DNA mismatch endonuclease (patch repair protein)
MPSTNVDYWEKKFQRNIERDRKEIQQLEDLGWRVIVVWECELKKPGFLESLPSMIRNTATRPAGDSHD